MRGGLRGAPYHHRSTQEHAAKQTVNEADSGGEGGRISDGKLHADNHANGKLGTEDLSA